MKHVLVMVTLLLVVPLVFTQTLPVVQNATLTGFGVYALEIKQIAGSEFQGIHKNIVTNIRLVEPTRNFQYTPGTALHFGGFYTMNGTPNGATVRLRKVLIYPAPGVVINGKTIPQTQSTLEKIVGTTFYIGNTIESNDPNVTAGDYTLQLYYGDQLLVSQPFHVTIQASPTRK